MCQATAYLTRDGQEQLEEIMQDVILLETTVDGVRLSTFFEEPRTVRARVVRIDFLKHTIMLVPKQRTFDSDSPEPPQEG
jgi:predicted RNA-binding protein